MSYLKQVSSGRVRGPYKIALFGEEGVGKSSFAADAPSPIFMDIENGTEDLDVQRMPPIKTFVGVLKAIEELTNDKHDWKTLVLDTADWLEGMIWEHVCEEKDVKSIEDVGYGKGHTAALEHWRTVLARLEMLRLKRKMHIIILAHAQIKKFQNPIGDDFDRYEMKLSGKTVGVVKEWPSALLFARFEVHTHKDKSGRVRGVSDKSRVIHTEASPAWWAKNRYGLPEQIPLSWDEFDAAARAGAPKSGAKLNEEIAALLESANAELKAQAEGGLKRANGDPIKLAKLADWLRGKLQAAA